MITAKASLKTVISGSFKFKPEIDQLHEAFSDHGVRVLEPTKGWLWTPTMAYELGAVRPLPNERGLTPFEIEERFLRAIDQSHFLYLNNPSSKRFSLSFFFAQNKFNGFFVPDPE